MANIANPLPYITKREYGIVPDLKATLFDNRLSAAKNLYRKDLKCHFGCVNAIEFSSNGELLISGGDDRRVMVWQFGQCVMERGQPEAMKTIHQSNIFCLGMSKDMKKIYSGGNDNMVIVHDIESKRPLEMLSHHRAVCCLSVDPYDDRVIATAGNDGRLLLFDTRQSVHESLVISRSKKAFHGVMFHPSQQGILVSANSRDGIRLWDLKAPKHPIVSYTGNHGTGQNCMSACFNRAGTRVLALRRRLPPVLYELYSPEPLAEFYHQDYYNSCTMKTCSFAGEDDKYVLSGSDDFNLYLWKVPEHGNEDRVVERPHAVLYGHRSIVNQVRFNPQYSLIASSGVEKIIKLWSTMEFPAMTGALMEEASCSDNPREIYSHEDYMSIVEQNGPYLPQTYVDQSTSEDLRMMAFFDSLVQRELECIEDESDSSDTLNGGGSGDDEMFIPSDFLPLVLPPTRLFTSSSRGRVPSRLAHLVPPYPKSSRSQKRGSSRRTKQLDRRALLSKFKMLPTRASAKGKQRSSGGSRNSHGLESGGYFAASEAFADSSPYDHPPPFPVGELFGGRSYYSGFHLRGPRAGARCMLFGAGAGAGAGTSAGERTDSDEPRPAHRGDGWNLQPHRRRMNPSRATKRKNKSTAYTESVMNLRSCESTADVYIPMNLSTTGNDIPMNLSTGIRHFHESMALPSTSTGYRGESASTMFRINEADSDDDQSPGSVQSSNYPLYADGTMNDSTQDSLIVEPPESDSTPPPESRHRLNQRRTKRTSRNLMRSDSSESPTPKHVSERASVALSSPQGYNNSTVARLMNETNESELESSCSTEGSMWPAPGSLGTPDSGVGTAAGSSTRHSQPADEVSDDPDWQALVLRHRVKKARRNYRKHIDSDSN